jgi:hypothetical protein
MQRSTLREARRADRFHDPPIHLKAVRAASGLIPCPSSITVTPSTPSKSFRRRSLSNGARQRPSFSRSVPAPHAQGRPRARELERDRPLPPDECAARRTPWQPDTTSLSEPNPSPEQARWRPGLTAGSEGQSVPDGQRRGAESGSMGSRAPTPSAHATSRSGRPRFAAGGLRSRALIARACRTDLVLFLARNLRASDRRAAGRTSTQSLRSVARSPAAPQPPRGRRGYRQFWRDVIQARRLTSRTTRKPTTPRDSIVGPEPLCVAQ